MLVEVPPVPFKDENNYVHVASRMSQEILKAGEYGKNVFYADQWDNLANRQAHIDGTGPGGTDIDCSTRCMRNSCRNFVRFCCSLSCRNLGTARGGN